MPDYFRSTFTFEGKRYFVKGRTQKEADQKAALKLAALEAGAQEASRRTVNDWWAEYLEVYKTRPNESTLALYKGIYNNSIAPHIGSKALKSVRSVDLQRIMNNLSTKSQSYAKKARFLLVGLFRVAEVNGLIPKSPANDLQLPEPPMPGQRRALTPEERSAFLEAAGALGHQGLFFLITYHCGLRPSEVARIHFEDIDGGVLHVRGTKTKAATRDVPIPKALTLPIGSGLLITTAEGQTVTKQAVRYWWSKVVRDMAKISGQPVASDLTPYCLRHDYCTRLSEKGVPIEIASKLMGHSTIALTAKIYHHTTDKMLDIARALIDS